MNNMDLSRLREVIKNEGCPISPISIEKLAKDTNRSEDDVLADVKELQAQKRVYMIAKGSNKRGDFNVSLTDLDEYYEAPFQNELDERVFRILAKEAGGKALRPIDISSGIGVDTIRVIQSLEKLREQRRAISPVSHLDEIVYYADPRALRIIDKSSE